MTAPSASAGEVNGSAEPNGHLIHRIIATAQADAAGTSNQTPRLELDSHANMAVVGSNAFIFESTGRTCNVQPFDKQLGVASNVPIVDSAIAYDCPYTSRTYILVMRNALHIPTMCNNLVPPFILREAGLDVNDKPKIHCKSPTKDDHCILFDGIELRIPLHLHGIFSYFNVRMPTVEELHNCDKVFMTPDSTDWNPNCESFSKNERAIEKIISEN